MMYAVVGIPLFFSYLSNNGDYMADVFRLCYAHVCRPAWRRLKASALGVDVYAAPSAGFAKPGGRSSTATSPGRANKVAKSSGPTRSGDAEATCFVDANGYATARPPDRQRSLLTPLQTPSTPTTGLLPNVDRDGQSPSVAAELSLPKHPPTSTSDRRVSRWRLSAPPPPPPSPTPTPMSTPMPTPMPTPTPTQAEASSLYSLHLPAGPPIGLVSHGSRHSSTGGGQISLTPTSLSDQAEQESTVPICLTLFIMAVYILIGAVVFCIWESKDYLKWSYFCFVTLSTIGFGDIVPGEWAALAPGRDKWPGNTFIHSVSKHEE